MKSVAAGKGKGGGGVGTLSCADQFVNDVACCMRIMWGLMVITAEGEDSG